MCTSFVSMAEASLNMVRIFLEGVIEQLVLHAEPKTWKSEEPVWVNQWPLTEEKIDVT